MKKVNSIFSKYAFYYDLLYKEKNYKMEAEYISKLIRKFTKKKSHAERVLDLACGTGRHAFCLADLGYAVEGSDISSEMIGIARRNARRLNKKVRFHNYSFQESNNIRGKFDVVLSMFSAIDYLTNLKDLSKSLKNIYNLLNEDGVFIFDYWNGNAVVRDYSPIKVLRKQDSHGGGIVRISETNLDIFNQLCIIKFSFMYFGKNSKMQEFEETHKLRYFYFDEINTFLELNGFKTIYRGPFMKLNESLDPFEWNVSVVAKKVRG